MKAFSLFQRLLAEQRREWWVAALLFSFGPLMVLIYYLVTGGGSTLYTVGYRNLDTGLRGTAYLEDLAGQRYPDGRPMLELRAFVDRAAAERSLRERSIDCLIEVPADFSAAVAGPASPPARLVVLRDFGNYRSSMPLLLAGAALEGLYDDRPAPITFVDEAIGDSAARSEFDGYIPGLLVFAVILLIFQASMTVARETEQLTLRRLAMSRMRAFDFFLGVTAFELVVGLGSVGLTLATAVACGFSLSGSLPALAAVLALACLSIIGLSLLLACFVRTTLQAFIVANIPLGILMFFSGAMMPLPKLVVAQIGDVSVGLFDFLPPTHAVAALNKLCSLSGGFGDVAYELVMLSVLSIAAFAGGIALFKAKRLSAP